LLLQPVPRSRANGVWSRPLVRNYPSGSAYQVNHFARDIFRWKACRYSAAEFRGTSNHPTADLREANSKELDLVLWQKANWRANRTAADSEVSERSGCLGNPINLECVDSGTPGRRRNLPVLHRFVRLDTFAKGQGHPFRSIERLSLASSRLAPSALYGSGKGRCLSPRAR